MAFNGVCGQKNQIKSLVAQYNTFIQPRVGNRTKSSERKQFFFYHEH